MIQNIVQYLNLRLETLGRIADLHGISERRKREIDGANVPYCYVGSGEFKAVNIDNGNVGWWRPRGGFNMEPVEVIGRAVRQQRATYPLRFVAVLRRELSVSDDAFMPSRLAEDIANALNFDNGDLRGILKAINVEARASGGEFDAATIWPTEFQTSIPDLRYELAMVAVDVTVEVVGRYSCWEGECATDTDILHLFNFCDPSVVARLTDAQRVCLEAAICPTPEDANWQLFNTEGTLLSTGSIPSGDTDSIVAPDATVLINTVQFDTVASGDDIDLPVVNGGSNPVGSEQSGEWVIGNSTVTINGTQVGDIVAEDTLPLAVELDGNPSGSWNAGTQTWEVTSTPCANGLLGINGNAGLVAVPSGGTANLEVRQGGVNVGSWDGTRWIVPPCAPATFSIGGTQVDTIASGADLDVTLLLDGVAPPSYTYNSGTDTLNVISPPPASGWQRPSDWIAIPDLTSADERGYFLVVVFENAYNQLGLTINNLAANINWGDGTSVVSNGSVQTKVYDYATLAGPISVWPDGRNYKQVLVDITRVGGAITSMSWTSATTVNPRGNNNVVDAIFSFPSLTTCALSLVASSGTRAMSLLQRLRVRNTGAVTTWQMGGLNSLQALEWADFEGTIPNDLLATVQVLELASLNISAVNALRMFSPSRIRKVGSITANNLTGATGSRNVFADCPILEEVGPITMNAATNLQSFFGSSLGCPMLTKVGLITAPNVQVLDQFVINCYSLEELIFSNCAAVTSVGGMVSNCVSLVNLVMPNLTRGVSFVTTAIGLTGMSNFANSIGTASGAQTITVTGTPFGALLTALNPTAVAIAAVMSGKGYTISN
jgi:hypothetical protein